MYTSTPATPSKEESAKIATEAFLDQRIFLLSKVIRTYPELAWETTVEVESETMSLVKAAIRMNYASVVDAALGLFPKSSEQPKPQISQEMFHHLLRAAVGKDNYGIVSTLLMAGADPNYQAEGDLGEKPLFVSLFHNKFRMSRLLLDAGAKADAVSRDGCHNVVTAALSNQRSVLPDRDLLMLMTKKGADINFSSGGQTPLKMAFGFRDPELLKNLITAGANVSKEAIGGELNDVLIKNDMGQHIPRILASILHRSISESTKPDEDSANKAPNRTRRVAVV